MAMHAALLGSESRTADVDSRIITIWEKYEAAHVVVDITSGTPNLVVTLKGKDPTSNKDYTILTSSTLSSGTTVLKVGPDYTAGTNVAKDYVPYMFYASVAQSGGVAATYSIGATFI